MKIFTSWDDGHIEDLRLAEMFKSYSLPAIFFLSNAGLELSISNIENLSKDFEIGGHTTSHPSDIKIIPKEYLENDIKANKQYLEDIIRKPIDWFCYPRGRYNQETIDVVKDAGYKYARTTLVGHTNLNEDSYRIHTTVHAHPHRQEYQGKNWVEYAKEKLLEAKLKNGYFHLWGHSYEIEKFSLWNELEQLLKFIYEHKNN